MLLLNALGVPHKLKIHFVETKQPQSEIQNTFLVQSCSFLYRLILIEPFFKPSLSVTN